MRNRFLCFFLLAMIVTFSKHVVAQSRQGQWSLGLGVGVQKLYGDSGIHDRFGFGADGSLSYHLSDRLGMTLAAGYDKLPYRVSYFPFSGDFTTNIIFVDLKFDFELLQGSFRPFLTAGAGYINYNVTLNNSDLKSEHFSDAAFIAGAGFRFALSHRVMFDIGANYKHTTGDGLDLTKGGANDSFLTLRSGVMLFLNPPKSIDSEPIFSDRRRDVPRRKPEPPFWNEPKPDQVKLDVSAKFVDQSGDGFLNSGEKGAIILSLVNAGISDAKDLRVKIIPITQSTDIIIPSNAYLSNANTSCTGFCAKTSCTVRFLAVTPVALRAPSVTAKGM